MLAQPTQTQVRSIVMRKPYLRMKRVLDVCFTLCISPFLLLTGLIIAVCIKQDSKGPIFYRQRRIGRNGRVFEMLKFRSMYTNSDEMMHREKIVKYMQGSRLSEDGELAFKDTHDPRITRVGRFIRKTSLDEVPQFWNVFRGDMSLVGPRPPLPYEVELYSARDRLRLSGPPGLTGTWQVYGRSRVTFTEMIDMDIEYLESQSFWLDLKLIALTVPVMVFARGGA